MNRPIAIVPALLLVGVLGAACSSSTSGGGTTAPTPSPGTSSSTSSPSTSPSSSASSSSGGAPSTATLKGIVVQQSDLPSGWTGKPAAAETAQDKQTDAQLNRCVGIPASAERDQVQQVMGDDFSKGQATVSSDTSSYKSDADVRQEVAGLRGSKTQSCISSLFRREIKSSLPAGATISAVGLKLDTSHNGGLSNLVGVANGSVTVTGQGKTIKAYLGVGFFTGPQLTGSVSFTSLGTPIPSSFADPILAAVAKRAANA